MTGPILLFSKVQDRFVAHVHDGREQELGDVLHDLRRYSVEVVARVVVGGWRIDGLAL
jgi:hypothetical protein